MNPRSGRITPTNPSQPGSPSPSRRPTVEAPRQPRTPGRALAFSRSLSLAFALLGPIPSLPPGHAAEAAEAAEVTGPSPGLREELEQQLSRPEFAAAGWGIRVVRADTGAEIFAHQAHALLKPGSNAKLFTAALALDLFGPDQRTRTDLIPRGKIRRDGTLQGDLVVFGRGDFSFASRFRPHVGVADPGGPVFQPPALSRSITSSVVRTSPYVR